MQIFPAEIWLQICGCLNNGDKLVLAKTSPALRHVAQASLFQEVHLFTLHKFTHSLIVRPNLGALVHNLSIVSDYDNLDTNRLLIRHFNSLCNLQILSLRGFVLDTKFCAAIAQLPCLTDVRFGHCTLDRDITSYPFTGSDITKLKLLLRPGRSSQRWDLVIHPALRSLKLQSYTEPTMDGLLSCLTLREDTFPFLTELSLDNNYTADITPLLNKAPQLRFLSVSQSSSPILDIPISTIPLLRSFKGPAESAALVSGRPVLSAALYLRSEGAVDTLLALRSSTAPLTELKFHGITPSTSFSALVKHFPDAVHTLRVDISPFHNLRYGVMRSWVAELSVLPALRVFELIALYVSDDQEEEYFRILSSGALPELRWARFGGNRWRVRKDGRWEKS